MSLLHADLINISAEPPGPALGAGSGSRRGRSGALPHFLWQVLSVFVFSLVALRHLLTSTQVCDKLTAQLRINESKLRMLDPSCETGGTWTGSLGATFVSDRGGCDRSEGFSPLSTKNPSQPF